MQLDGERPVECERGSDGEDKEGDPLDVLQKVVHGDGRSTLLGLEAPGDIVVGNVDIRWSFLLGLLLEALARLFERRGCLSRLYDGGHGGRGGGRDEEEEEEGEKEGWRRRKRRRGLYTTSPRFKVGICWGCHGAHVRSAPPRSPALTTVPTDSELRLARSSIPLRVLGSASSSPMTAPTRSSALAATERGK